MPGVWRSNAYLLVSFPLGIATFVCVVTLLSLGISLLIIWVGVPILIALIEGNRWFATLERRRAGWLLGEPIPSLYLPQHRRGMLGYLHTAIGDTAVWKDLLWLGCPAPRARPDGLHHRRHVLGRRARDDLPARAGTGRSPTASTTGCSPSTSCHEAFAVVPVGLVLFALTVPLTRALGLRHGLAGPRPARARASAAASTELERTRAGAVDAQAAELQRIERDLHDGAQARLVALAMDLGMAQEKMASDPEGAQALITGAHSEAKKAIAELRDLSRGIYPAILTDRGLGPALSSIAARNPVEVALDVDLDGRLPAATEAAAYFVTVEALTNVAKHSGAAQRARAHRAPRRDAARRDRRRRRRRRRPRTARA